MVSVDQQLEGHDRTPSETTVAWRIGTQ